MADRTPIQLHARRNEPNKRTDRGLDRDRAGDDTAAGKGKVNKRMLMLAAALPAAALPPSGPWNVEAEEDICLLSRPYGAGPDTFVVGFQPIFGEPRMDFVILTRGKNGQQDIGAAIVERMPDGQKFKGSFVGLSTLSGRQYLMRISIDRALFDDLGKTTELRVKAGPISKHVQIASFDKAKPVFENCERELLRGWGVDPAAMADGRGAKPKENIARYFQPGTYPTKALNMRYIGRSTVILNISELGTVTKCRVIVGAGTELNEATCQNAAKIPFEPGKSKSGKAEPSIYVLRVSWQLP